MAFVPTCLLIRHGRTASNADGTLAGWTEGVGLDDTGRGQAASLAERLRGLPIRAVVSSRTYQLSARTNELNADDTLYFSHAYTRLLPAEVLLDAISTD